jgi:2-C-methyl-D-erythritol 4-phosphate cytidylyltransferase
VVLVDGGGTRQDSVWRALQAVPFDAGWIAVHDACRPFASVETFRKVIEAAQAGGAAICGVAPVDTIKSVRADGGEAPVVGETLDRSSLVAVQTPQVFAASLLREAHEAARRDGFIERTTAGSSKGSDTRFPSSRERGQT